MNEVKQIGNYKTESTWDNPQTGRVYSADGISPTLNTCNGGDRQPKIVIGSLQDHAAIKTDGICTTLTEAMGMGGGQTNDCSVPRKKSHRTHPTEHQATTLSKG